MVRILGLDPGSRITGYGVVDAGREGVRYVASGCIRVGNGDMAGRLLEIHRHVTELVVAYAPGEIAVERVFMHRNPDSALKLGQARGAALCGACHAGAPVFEYAPRAVKQTVTGTGGAEKSQVMHMVKALLALDGKLGADAADALAIAVCHAQHRGSVASSRPGNGR
jgi:crossover junction endodeoxyribonuclease RuvC